MQTRVTDDALTPAKIMMFERTDMSLARPAAATLPFVTAARDYVLDRLNDEAAAERRSKGVALVSSRRARSSW